MQVHFQNIAHVIEKTLRQARKDISIAVCWFTHPGIFEAVLDQCQRGTCVTLIVNYDLMNIQPLGKLDFEAFIRAGGHFYGYILPELMHHKFCIIDQQLLINGSFNWTQNNNLENILLTKQPESVQAFLCEFEKLRTSSRHFNRIDYTLVKTFQSLLIPEDEEYSEQTFRKKIIKGAQVWIYHSSRDKIIWEEMASSGVIGFKNKAIMTQFWEKNRHFEKNDFLDLIKKNKATAIEKATCRAWCLRLKQGDMIIGCNRLHQSILSFGIVQSVPFLYGHFHTGRQVSWIKNIRPTPLAAGIKIPVAMLSLYKGSYFELVSRLGHFL